MAKLIVKIRAEAPTRVDLAGGTLDLWPIHQLLDFKATVNVGVTLPAIVDVATSADDRFHLSSADQDQRVTGDYQRVTTAPELPLLAGLLKALWPANAPALAINTAAKSPAGAGLGGSSCLGIALAAALDRTRAEVGIGPLLPSEERLVALVQDVEARLIHAPTGTQDYWGAVRGRVNILTFAPGRPEVQTLDPQSLTGLSEQLILCYSGRSRASAMNNWEIFKKLFDGDRDLLKLFNDLGAAAEQCAAAAADGDLEMVLKHSSQEWTIRQRLWPGIETSETRTLAAAAKAAGAHFSRVCGAGGGGVMAIFAPADKRGQVERALASAGGAVLPGTVALSGLSVKVASGH